jgi:hypothetical protein
MKRLYVLLLVVLLLPLTGAERDIRTPSKHAHGAIQDERLTLGELVELGRIPGAYSVHKFGYNADVDTTEESVWDGNDAGGPGRCFTVLTTAQALYLSSASASDNTTKSVVIDGLDANYERVQSAVTLNGLGFVAAGTWLRVNRMYMVGGANVGRIYLHTDDADAAVADGIPDSPSTQIVATITAGESQTLQSCYTVPAGFTAYIAAQCITNAGTGGANSITFRGRVSTTGAEPRRVQFKITLGQNNAECREVHPMATLPEKTDFEITASNSTSQAASGFFDMLLIPLTE